MFIILYIFITKILTSNDENMFKALNKLREEKGLKHLIRDEKLDRVCEIRAERLRQFDGKIPEDKNDDDKKAYFEERMKIVEFDNASDAHEVTHDTDSYGYKEVFDYLKEMDPGNNPFLENYELIGIGVSKISKTKIIYWDMLLVNQSEGNEDTGKKTEDKEDGEDDEDNEDIGNKKDKRKEKKKGKEKGKGNKKKKGNNLETDNGYTSE